MNFNNSQKENYNSNNVSEVAYSGLHVTNEVMSTLLRKVYAWMFLSLVLTGFTAFAVSNNYNLLEMIYSNAATIWILIIAQLGLAILFTASLHKMSLLHSQDGLTENSKSYLTD